MSYDRYTVIVIVVVVVVIIITIYLFIYFSLFTKPAVLQVLLTLEIHLF